MGDELMVDELHLEEEERKFPTLRDGSGSGSSFRTTRAARCFHSRAQDIPTVTMETARCSCSSHGWLEWRWRRRWDGERRAAARGGRREMARVDGGSRRWWFYAREEQQRPSNQTTVDVEVMDVLPYRRKMTRRGSRRYMGQMPF